MKDSEDVEIDVHHTEGVKGRPAARSTDSMCVFVFSFPPSSVSSTPKSLAVLFKLGECGIKLSNSQRSEIQDEWRYYPPSMVACWIHTAALAPARWKAFASTTAPRSVNLALKVMTSPSTLFWRIRISGKIRIDGFE
jgi:hypothetical protein